MSGDGLVCEPHVLPRSFSLTYVKAICFVIAKAICFVIQSAFIERFFLPYVELQCNTLGYTKYCACVLDCRTLPLGVTLRIPCCVEVSFGKCKRKCASYIEPQCVSLAVHGGSGFILLRERCRNTLSSWLLWRCPRADVTSLHKRVRCGAFLSSGVYKLEGAFTELWCVSRSWSLK